MKWERHWGLSKDPFRAGEGVYVPIPGHDEAVARLTHTVEAEETLAVLRAGTGLGKTRVLNRAILESRSANRRIVSVGGPVDGTDLLATLAQRLDGKGPRSGSRAEAWNRLTRAIRLCALERLQVVLAVDDVGLLRSEDLRDTLSMLTHLGDNQRARVTLLLATGHGDEGTQRADWPWTLMIGLKPLLRSELEVYVANKLGEAGCRDAVFTPKALIRLHAISEGVPKGIDRLASLCLMAAAARRAEAVSSDVVDGVATECYSSRVPPRFDRPGVWESPAHSSINAELY